MTQKVLKIALRSFDGFERSISRQFEAWRIASGHDVRLEWQRFEVDDLPTELFERQGLKSGKWDIGFICTDWLDAAVSGHHLLDLSSMMGANPVSSYPEGWSPALLEAQTSGEQVFGLPYHVGPQCLIYRRDLMEDPGLQAAYRQTYGRPLEIPADWNTFKEVASFLSEPSAGRYGTIVSAYPDGHNTVYDFCALLWARGGELFDGSGKPALSSDAARDAVEFYRSMLREPGLVHPEFASTTSVTAGNVFARGEAAMMINWFSCAAFAQLFGTEGVRGNIGVAPLPGATPERPTSLLVYWVLGIGAGSSEPELAYEFLRHAASAELDRITALEGGIGARRSTWSDSQVLAEIPFYGAMEAIYRTARMPPSGPGFAALGPIINTLMNRAAGTDIPTADLVEEARQAALEAGIVQQ
ncbi:extracellular solute-binding protein [Rhizobium sp. KVB221]|uniref:Extracellular solute-binding protein n=1 Tax=Rhizobium setariae TaxID=2801340 RepID=A0A937CLL0_9HYPH|nr:extracellular solute-binding protein [Rhizobium setariae]